MFPMQPVIEKVGLTEYRERYDELTVSCFLYLAVSIYFNLLIAKYTVYLAVSIVFYPLIAKL